MGEILDFKQDKRKTASGRFFITAARQAEHLEQEAETRRRRQKPKPTPTQSARASRELEFIFSGENQQLADRMYRDGRSDVVYQRKPPATQLQEEAIRMFGLMGITFYEDPDSLTPEAQFYIHIEQLTEIANHAYDRAPDPLQ